MLGHLSLLSATRPRERGFVDTHSLQRFADMSTGSSRRLMPAQVEPSSSLGSRRGSERKASVTTPAAKSSGAADRLGVFAAARTPRIRYFPDDFGERDHADLLEIERRRLLSHGAHNLDAIPRNESSNNLAELFRWLVGSHIDGVDREQHMTALQAPCSMRHDAFKTNRSIWFHSSTSNDVIIGSLIRFKEKPSVRSLATDQIFGG